MGLGVDRLIGYLPVGLYLHGGRYFRFQFDFLPGDFSRGYVYRADVVGYGEWLGAAVRFRAGNYLLVGYEWACFHFY